MLLTVPFTRDEMFISSSSEIKVLFDEVGGERIHSCRNIYSLFQLKAYTNREVFSVQYLLLENRVSLRMVVHCSF